MNNEPLVWIFKEKYQGYFIWQSELSGEVIYQCTKTKESPNAFHGYGLKELRKAIRGW